MMVAIPAGSIILGGVLTVAGAEALQKLFNEEANQLWGNKTGWQDASDAFRHAYVAARFAQYFGKDTPVILGATHEALFPSQADNPGADTLMDLLNNYMGAEIGSKYGWFDSDAASKIADELMQAIRDGALITSPDDPRVKNGLGQGDTDDNTNNNSKNNYGRTGVGGTGAGNGSTGGIGEGGAQSGLAGTAFPYVDPLVLDLDGDGIETVGIDAKNRIKFDHDADGIKTGTGWISSDDGWLVLDRNGNGRIDSGRELFGVETVKSNGQLASNGFDALGDYDSNGDGVISTIDPAEVILNISLRFPYETLQNSSRQIPPAL